MIRIIKYCPTCNRSSDKVRFVGEICEVCTADRLRKDFRRRADVVHCERCGRLKVPGGYLKPSDQSMAAALQKQLSERKYKVRVISFDQNAANVEIAVDVGGEEVKFEMRIELAMTHQICQDCYRKSSGYFEAVVQVRGDRERVERFLKKFGTYVTRKGAFIGKVDWIDGGLDIYVSDKALAGMYFTKNGISSEKSYTLYGVKNGRKVYRNTYLIRYGRKD